MIESSLKNVKLKGIFEFSNMMESLKKMIYQFAVIIKKTNSFRYLVKSPSIILISAMKYKVGNDSTHWVGNHLEKSLEFNKWKDHIPLCTF